MWNARHIHCEKKIRILFLRCVHLQHVTVPDRHQQSRWYPVDQVAQSAKQRHGQRERAQYDCRRTDSRLHEEGGLSVYFFGSLVLGPSYLHAGHLFINNANRRSPFICVVDEHSKREHNQSVHKYQNPLHACRIEAAY